MCPGGIPHPHLLDDFGVEVGGLAALIKPGRIPDAIAMMEETNEVAQRLGGISGQLFSVAFGERTFGGSLSRVRLCHGRGACCVRRGVGGGPEVPGPAGANRRRRRPVVSLRSARIASPNRVTRGSRFTFAKASRQVDNSEHCASRSTLKHCRGEVHTNHIAQPTRPTRLLQQSLG